MLAAWGGNRPLMLASAAIVADSLIASLLIHGDGGVAWQCALDGVLLIVAASRTRPQESS